MTNIYKEYAQTKQKIQALQEKEATLKEIILTTLQKEGIEKEERTEGVFTIARRAIWKYTTTIKKLEEKLKVQKVKEQQRGDAKASYTTYLVFTQPE